jgi:beta-1,4-mannosyl-glycoprotein beta-1,4-N-acetylglucosaminyltransferase
MFYNELDVLELRLRVLDKHVDLFVLVESEVTHVGLPKPLYFNENKERFSKWLPKIRHVSVPEADCPKDENPWAREKHQREQVNLGLGGVPDEAWVMISDVDEIPWVDKIQFKYLDRMAHYALHMYMFEYSFDYMFTGEPWVGTTIAKKGQYQNPNHLRDNRWRLRIIPEAGWHLSSFGDAAHVFKKMQTYAHAKDPHHRLQTEALFKEWILNGLHTDGKMALLPRPDSVPLPESPEVLARLGLGKFPSVSPCAAADS